MEFLACSPRNLKIKILFVMMTGIFKKWLLLYCSVSSTKYALVLKIFCLSFSLCLFRVSSDSTTEGSVVISPLQIRPSQDGVSICESDVSERASSISSMEESLALANECNKCL